MAILLADSGGTKTHWRLLDGTEKTDIYTAGISPLYQNEAQILDMFQSELLPKIKIYPTAVYYYGTGIIDSSKAQIVENALLTIWPKTPAVEVKDDMLGAARALCGRAAGIACILGTGANSCMFNGQEISQKTPALGFWLGDEGSGGHIGKELIKSYLRLELPVELKEAFDKRFGALDRSFVLKKAYQEPLPNRYFASFSKFIWDHRHHPFCYHLVTQAFGLFLEKNVLPYSGHELLMVNFTGSVAFYYSDILKKVLQKFNLTCGIIAESPMAGLTLYHR
jgi:glucosamine kinase